MKGIQRHFKLSKRELHGILGIWFILAVLSAVGLYLRRPPDVSIVYENEVVKTPSGDEVQMTHDIYLDSIVVYDPNTVTWHELTQMGLREQVASSWLAWRKAGKVFRCTQDIESVRGISSQELEMVMPHLIWHNQADDPLLSNDYNQEDNTPSYHEGYGVKKEEELQQVNLNQANSLSLEALPGLGPVLSQRIIRYRELLGGFVDVNQLLEVYGLRESHYNLAADHLYVLADEVATIDLDSVAFRDLLRHPYASYHLTKALFDRYGDGITLDSMETALEDSLRLPFLKIKPYLYHNGNEQIDVTISN